MLLLYCGLTCAQDKALSSSFNAVPDEFSGKITLAQHQKAAEYTQSQTQSKSF